MENNKTTEEQIEALITWYKAKVKSRLNKKNNMYLICTPDYKPYALRECPERMWPEYPRKDCNCD